MNKSYLKTRRKKSIASLILAFLLMITFNSSPILLVSNQVRNANAYKSSETKTFYSSPKNESESKFSDPNYPSAYVDAFDGSNKNFNLFTYYNSKFEEYYFKTADTFFKNYTVNNYDTHYKTFLNKLGADTLAELYKEQKDSDLFKANLTTISPRDLIARLALTGFSNYIIEDNPSDPDGDPIHYTMPPLVTDPNLLGEYVRLSDFYRLFANYTVDNKNINSVPQDEKKTEDNEGRNPTNFDITTAEAFYKKATYADKQASKIVGNTHYNRIVDKIDSMILESAPTYAFDHTTQDTNVAAIFANMVPTTVAYNYIANSYESYNEPSASYKTTKVTSGAEKNTVYYFGAQDSLNSVASSEFEMSSDERRIYIVSTETEYSNVEIKSLDDSTTYTFVAISQATINADKNNFFVALSSDKYSDMNISSSYKLYYKHTSIASADLRNYLYYVTESPKNETDVLMYRPILVGEHGYIDAAHPTYYKYSSSPYLTTSSKKDVYVLTDSSTTQNELDTIASVYFKTLSKSEYDSNKDFYVQVPYESDELYFKAIYNNLYSNIGFYGETSSEKFKTFVSYFTEGSGANKTSKLYLRMGSSTKKYVYIDQSKLETFQTENPGYIYNVKTYNTSDASYNPEDYYEIIENSSNASYFVKSDSYKLYFAKSKDFYTKPDTSVYETDTYETTYAPSIPLEKDVIASNAYEMDLSERKIYVVSTESENSPVEIKSKDETITYNFTAVAQSTIDTDKKGFYVEVPSYIYNNKNISDTYKLYYKHTENTKANKLYIVDDSDSAADNKIYQTLNYNVIKSTELKSNITKYVAVKEGDVNYNKDFQLYYKYTRSLDTNIQQVYILNHTGLSLGESSMKVIEQKELSDYILIENDKDVTNGTYQTYYASITTPASIDEIKLYRKLTSVFVQNQLKDGNAVYVLDTSVSTEEKETYSRLMYTPVTQKEIDNNPGLYVLIDSNDESNYFADYKLYYKYQTEVTPSRVVYSYENIDKSSSSFDRNDYELITEANKVKDGDYIEGQERYYKKIVKETKTQEDPRPTFYYYQTTSTTTLSANSYYVISFYVSTIGENARASFVVKDTANIIDPIAINNIDTESSWQKYYIFLSTNVSTASTINLYLYLGDEEHGVKGNTSAENISGSIFFDEIKITKIGLTDYNKFAIDDIAIYSEETMYESTPGQEKYADEYDNRAIIANTDPRFESNKFEARDYLDSTIDVYDNNSWNDIFNFDDEDLQNNLLGKDTGVENEKVANKLDLPARDSDGFDMYNTSFTKLWKYYISRDLENDYSISKFINAYNDGKLEVTTTNKIEESEEPEKDEDEKKEDDKKEDKVEDEAEKSDIKYISSPFNTNNFALKLKNTSRDTSLGITSNSFKVKQFEYYKISLWIYSPDLEGTATISVNSVLTDRQHPTYGSLLSATITSTYANVEKSASKNAEYGWIPVNLYIEGNNFQDMDCYLVLSADADCTVYFDNIRVEKTTSAQYDTAKSNSSSDKYITALSLTPTTSLITSDLTNGTFDYIKESSTTHDVTSVEPYVADNWTTLSTNSSRVVAGVVSTQQPAFFNEYSKDGSDNVIIPKEYTTDISNIYAIYSPSTVKTFDNATEISYKHTYSIYSASLSLSANTLYKISFKFFKNDNFSGKVFSNIYASAVKTANVIATMEIDASNDTIVKDEEWTTFTYYIATATSSQTIYLEIGVKDAQETCFFKTAAAKKVADKTIDAVIKSEADKLNLDSSSTETLYNAFDTIKFLNLANSDFSFHSLEQNADTNLYDPKSFTNDSTNTKDHTAGKVGVTVASYFDTINHSTYSVTIEKVTYYIGEVYEVTIDETKYYVHKTYDAANNRFEFKLYSDSELKTEVTKIDDELVKITYNGSLNVKVGETAIADDKITTTYRLYKYADLREEVKTISGSDVSVPSLEKVVVGKGAHATETDIVSQQNTSYVYHFATETKKDYEIGNTIIPATELKNAQSANVMILTNDHATDYVKVTQATARSLGKSTFNVLRVYVKTSDFNRDDIGLNISVKAVNVNWTNINTTKSDFADEYGFVCYEILVASSSTDSIADFAVSFSLGNTKDSDTGYAIISKVSIEALANQDAFDHYSAVAGDKETVKKAIYTKDATSTDSAEKADDKNSLDWSTFFYVFSSILLVATMVVAMVAVVLKKHPIKGTEKFENDHERDIQTISSKTKKSSNAPKSTKTPRAKKDEIIIDLSNDEPTTKKDDGGIV